jgi:hypothetical protein
LEKKLSWIGLGAIDEYAEGNCALLYIPIGGMKLVLRQIRQVKLRIITKYAE